MQIAMRSAKADDYELFLALFELLQTGDPLPSRERFTSELSHTMLFAERGGRPVGYLRYELFGALAYVRNVATALDARRTGVAKAMMEFLRTTLLEQGVTSWELNVRPDNEAAVRLYEVLGMTKVYDSVALKFPMDHLPSLPVPSGGNRVLEVVPDDDSRLERGFGLIDGQLAASRKNPNRVCLELRDRNETSLGVAILDKSFPGAFPFCVSAEQEVRSFLEAFRTLCSSEVTELNIVVERSPALEAVLVKAGAKTKMRLAHYAGTLKTP